MLDHVDFAVRHLAKSRAFYVAALAPLRLVPVVDFEREDGRKGTGFGAEGIGEFFIGGGPPVEGRLHVAFVAETESEVNEFHAAALAAGGSDHGEPGLRLQYGYGYYAAYVRDPDGHIVEAVFRRSSHGRVQESTS